MVRTWFRGALAATAGLALLALPACSIGSDPGKTTMAGSSADSLQKGYQDVISKVLPSVVQITTGQDLGSGIVYDKQGDIVTNAHVVGTAQAFQVTFATGGKPMAATLVASYPTDDIAVIKVSGSLPVGPASFADSSKLSPGEIVLAMGNPLGLSSSVTNGIVSAVGRTVAEPRTASSPGTTIPDMVQTSAAINPGNSGGALVGLDGKVVGVPTLAATDQQGGGAAPGIGFAVSSNVAKNIADQLIKGGRVTNSGRAALGVTVQTVVDADAKESGAGVISVVQGGPAAKAGLQPGDVITAVGDTKVASAAALNEALAGLKPGATTKVTYQRDGTSHTAEVTLGEL